MPGEIEDHKIHTASKGISDERLHITGSRLEHVGLTQQGSRAGSRRIGGNNLRNNDEEPYDPFNPSYRGPAPPSFSRTVEPNNGGRNIKNGGKKRRKYSLQKETSRKKEKSKNSMGKMIGLLQ